MEIVVLCFVYTILTQLVFFFFSCYAEIFIVNIDLLWGEVLEELGLQQEELVTVPNFDIM